MTDRDYSVILNNLLQAHPTGNISHNLHYVFAQEGSNGDPTHIATAIFRGATYGVGRGKSKGAARRAAAKVAYEEFSTNGVPET